MEIILSIIGTIVTVASFVYAIMTNREKARLEKLIQAELWFRGKH